MLTFLQYPKFTRFWMICLQPYSAKLRRKRNRLQRSLLGRCGSGLARDKPLDDYPNLPVEVIFAGRLAPTFFSSGSPTQSEMPSASSGSHSRHPLNQTHFPSLVLNLQRRSPAFIVPQRAEFSLVLILHCIQPRTHQTLLRRPRTRLGGAASVELSLAKKLYWERN